ncbi:MAG TPA: STAS domain-containing protein [Thermodesulfobacteriota bacterium]|nr:STAS domain-containing protein [Thermodesulfobacteriota bacterium]
MKKKNRNFMEMEDCVVLFADEYLNDVEGEKLEELCDAFLMKGVKKLIIDFSDTGLINSVGISILVGIMDKLKGGKGVLLFSGLKKVNHDIFNMLGLTKNVPVCKTPQEALKMIEGGSPRKLTVQ